MTDKITTERLEKLIEDEAQKEELKLHALYNVAKWTECMEVKECSLPKTWRLVEAGGSKGELEDELVFTLYGTIIAQSLPPFHRSVTNIKDLNRAKYLKQGVTIGGAGSKQFEHSLLAIGQIHEEFDKSFKQGELEGLSHEYKDDHGTVVSATNRLLTPTGDTAASDRHIPFDNTCDPHGALEALVRNGFKHTEDQVVSYLERKVEATGKVK
ncbi:hypothetical protein H0H92_016009 [Tricholoma furcatifolium]|nr:hypothetical protein H0H92_016009 [Tricholoma furcatifolium]